MKTTPEIQAINLLVEMFDAITGYRHDDWTLPQIMAWFEGYQNGKAQYENSNREP